MTGVSSPVVLSPAVPLVGVAAPSAHSLTEELGVNVGVTTTVPSLPSGVAAPANVVPSSDGDEDIPLSDVLVVAGKNVMLLLLRRFLLTEMRLSAPRRDRLTRPELRPRLLVLLQET